jgi:hypothetical protein
VFKRNRIAQKRQLLRQKESELAWIDNDISNFKVNQMANTDLVTYYGQTEKIDQLVEKYGRYLEKLDRETKLLLRITLSTYIFMQQEYNSTEYPVLAALEDALCELLISDSIPQDLYDICSVLEGLTVDEAETLLEALQHQIRWGNARLMVSK